MRRADARRPRHKQSRRSPPTTRANARHPRPTPSLAKRGDRKSPRRTRRARGPGRRATSEAAAGPSGRFSTRRTAFVVGTLPNLPGPDHLTKPVTLSPALRGNHPSLGGEADGVSRRSGASGRIASDRLTSAFPPRREPTTRPIAPEERQNIQLAGRDDSGTPDPGARKHGDHPSTTRPIAPEERQNIQLAGRDDSGTPDPGARKHGDHPSTTRPIAREEPWKHSLAGQDGPCAPCLSTRHHGDSATTDRPRGTGEPPTRGSG
jgi:hypothetical protein